MKNQSLALLILAQGFATAGEEAGSKTAAVLAPPTAPVALGCEKCTSHTGWIAGGSVDYFFIEDAVGVSGHAGYEWAGKYDDSHAAFVEAGWIGDTGADESFDIVPLTANYRYKKAITRCLSLYAGGGLGLAFTNSEFDNTRIVSETRTVVEKDRHGRRVERQVTEEREVVERVDDNDVVFLAFDDGFNDIAISLGATGKF